MKKAAPSAPVPERLTAVLISLAVLVYGAFMLTPDTTWGDDNAAYLNEAIAIAEGRFDEQSRMNYYYHPTALPEEADGRLVYVWGYPLVQSLVYRLLGFDSASLFWYKLPLLLALALSGGILFLFYRRRLSRNLSAALALLFCLHGELTDGVNHLYSDHLFLFLSVLTLYLMEGFPRRAEGGRALFYNLLCGLSLWMCYETRLSGGTVAAAALLGFFLAAARGEVRGKNIWKILLPYLIMAGLILVSERLWLSPATANVSDLTGRGPRDPVHAPASHGVYYLVLTVDFLAAMVGLRCKPALFEPGSCVLPSSEEAKSFLLSFYPAGLALGLAMLLLSIFGLLKHGFGKNGHLTLFFAGTLLVLCLLPYTQGLRYMYNILPILLLYLGCGLEDLGRRLRRPTGRKRLRRPTVTLAWLGLALLICVPKTGNDLRQRALLDERFARNVYSPDALEVYRYIRDRVPAEEAIAVIKPRMLYLNTGHLSFRPGVNRHELGDAGYYLELKFPVLDSLSVDLDAVMLTPVLDNPSFTLYRVEEK